MFFQRWMFDNLLNMYFYRFSCHEKLSIDEIIFKKIFKKYTKKYIVMVLVSDQLFPKCLCLNNTILCNFYAVSCTTVSLGLIATVCVWDDESCKPSLLYGLYQRLCHMSLPCWRGTDRASCSEWSSLSWWCRQRILWWNHFCYMATVKSVLSPVLGCWWVLPLPKPARSFLC